jgi:hypothetical protein
MAAGLGAAAGVAIGGSEPEALVAAVPVSQNEERTEQLLPLPSQRSIARFSASGTVAPKFQP